MAQQLLNTVENNFTGGLKTENNPLSFPENACTDTDNCVFSIIGDVNRRPGIDWEANSSFVGLIRQDRAMSSFIWDNAGGDGNTKLYVQQVGGILTFYDIGHTTDAAPLSANRLSSTVDITRFTTSAPDASILECEYAAGNGYLIVFNPFLDPFYVTYSAGVISSFPISVNIRDTIGIPEPGVPDTFRSSSLITQPHYYNLLNQGWTNAPAWTASSNSTVTLVVGSLAFTVAAGIPGITPGDSVVLVGASTIFTPVQLNASGIVTSYAGTTLTISITAFNPTGIVATGNSWSISKTGGALLSSWIGSIGNNPSNSDQWWRFKDNTGVFNPTATYPNTVLNQGPAPKGAVILPAFFQRRNVVTDAVVTPTITFLRPRTGSWFQGRVWYAGVDDSFTASGTAPRYSWSENIYFSQIVETTDQFGRCYQTNDPTSEDLFDLLPTDGGVIQIQGSGSVYKLFPVQNGLLVFSANGIWFITGSQGIGFSATDYTITKISSVHAMSSTSFINVLGYPVFWNEEGIYNVTPSQQGGGLEVQNLCIGTINTFYSQIPSISKRYARGDYDPVNYTIKWLYRSIPEDFTRTSRYNFDRVLNINTSSKAFYPYTISSDINTVNDLKYVIPPASANAATGVFKYTTSYPFGGGNYIITFSEERDTTNWRDFKTYDGIGVNYESFFVTGYKLHGQALTKFQPLYITIFSNGETNTSYKIQAIWDFATDPNSGKFSVVQLVTNALTRFGIVYRRHRIRGRGLALQFKIKSSDGLPFSIFGWSTVEAKNMGV